LFLRVLTDHQPT